MVIGRVIGDLMLFRMDVDRDVLSELFICFKIVLSFRSCFKYRILEDVRIFGGMFDGKVGFWGRF